MTTPIQSQPSGVDGSLFQAAPTQSSAVNLHYQKPSSTDSAREAPSQGYSRDRYLDSILPQTGNSSIAYKDLLEMALATHESLQKVSEYSKFAFEQSVEYHKETTKNVAKKYEERTHKHEQLDQKTKASEEGQKWNKAIAVVGTVAGIITAAALISSGVGLPAGVALATGTATSTALTADSVFFESAGARQVFAGGEADEKADEKMARGQLWVGVGAAALTMGGGLSSMNSMTNTLKTSQSLEAISKVERSSSVMLKVGAVGGAATGFVSGGNLVSNSIIQTDLAELTENVQIINADIDLLTDLQSEVDRITSTTINQFLPFALERENDLTKFTSEGALESAKTQQFINNRIQV